MKAARRVLSQQCRRPFTSASIARDPPQPITLQERPTKQDLDDIFDSFDESASHLSAEARNDPALQPSQLTPTSETFLSEIELKRRRDRTISAFENIGSTREKHYSPRTGLHAPPKVEEIGIDMLIASQAHMGHSTTLWNPVTQPYIYGSRNGIHFFNLDHTLSHLRRAAEVVKGVAQNDGNILFVGTRPGQKRSVVEAARRAGAYHVFDRWIPGTITNGKQVVGHGRVKQLITKHKNNSSPPSNPILAPNSIVPDLVVVLNPLENRNLLKECAKGRVPTIGIIDTDADPRWVTYAIPANDDSLRCTSLIVGTLSQAAAAGRANMAVPDWEQVEVSATA